MLKSLITQFLKLEASSGILLLSAAAAALILCNSPYASIYQQFFHTPNTLQLGSYTLVKPLLFWINDGLMCLFFLIIGLELKRDLLTRPAPSSSLLLPAMAALGGMLAPALLFYSLNQHDPIAVQGWAIPVATDIAFALGVLSLFGKRVPIELRLFLMALAIFDDLGAIIIIAFFQTHSLSYPAALKAGISLLILLVLNGAGVKNLWLYLLVGCALWLFTLQSGIHPTIAGVLLALSIPTSPAHTLERKLHPWVAYGVMPIFAFANAGLSLQGTAPTMLLDTTVFGVLLALFLGKQSGVVLSTWAVIKLGWAKLPHGTSWPIFYGIAILCGIGFTMSLFLGMLAYHNQPDIYYTRAQLGVFAGSILSGLVGAVVLECSLRKNKTALASMGG